MNEPIRMLHFADVHIGMENYGHVDPETGTSSRVRDFLDRLDEVVDYGLDHGADLAVFAGDAFKSRDPDPTQQREFAQRIKQLADAMPTLLLVGNHDMPAMSSKASSVDIFRALQVPNVIVGHKAEGQVVETKRGPVYLGWVPYPMRNRLLTREQYQGKSIEELQDSLQEVVTTLIRQLGVEAQEHSMPRVLAAHLTVAEAKFGSERSALLGRDVAVYQSVIADDSWDYVALGHIHRHQLVNPDGYPPVVYSGSLERIDFGEEGERKGFCWVELQRGATTWKFVPVNARPFHTVRVDAREGGDPTGVVLDRLGDTPPGAVVRLIVQLRADQEPSFRENEIRDELEAASSLTIAREVDTPTRTRLGDTAPEALTPLELLERYLEARDVPENRRADLLDRAVSLLDTEN